MFVTPLFMYVAGILNVFVKDYAYMGRKRKFWRIMAFAGVK